jgi:hypothetical protein
MDSAGNRSKKMEPLGIIDKDSGERIPEHYPERGTFLRSNGRMLSCSLTSVLPEEKLMRNLLASLLLVSGLSLTARAIDYDDKKSLTADEIISKHLEGAGEMFQKGSFE